MSKSVLSLVCVIVVLSTTTATGSSRKAEKIVRKHVAAMGGDRLGDFSSLHGTGHIEVRRFTAPLTMWRERPNLNRVEVTLMGHDIIQAYDGDVAWWVNPLAGATTPEEMPDDFAREIVFWSDFEGPLINYKKKRHKLKYLGKEELETGEAYKIRVLMSTGGEVTVYLDVDTHLEMRRTHVLQFNDKALTINTYFSNYKKVKGVTVPHSIRGVGPGGEGYVMTFQKIDLNGETNGERFVMPGRHSKSRGASGY